MDSHVCQKNLSLTQTGGKKKVYLEGTIDMGVRFIRVSIKEMTLVESHAFSLRESWGAVLLCLSADQPGSVP